MKKASVTLPKSDNNAWARGCGKCKHGIANAPELTGACELYLERLVQALDNELTFCACQAGVAYRAFLLNRFEFLKREAKKDPRMADFAERKTHPDIEAARKCIGSSYGYVKVPPIRWVDEPLAPPSTVQVEVPTVEAVTA